tara:strand:- start:6989 stop:7324 length:336 start_codon:yes stop_codon:yes gene_type:complete
LWLLETFAVCSIIFACATSKKVAGCIPAFGWFALVLFICFVLNWNFGKNYYFYKYLKQQSTFHTHIVAIHLENPPTFSTFGFARYACQPFAKPKELNLPLLTKMTIVKNII